MGTEKKEEYKLFATMTDGSQVEIGEISSIEMEDMEEILESMEFIRVIRCKNCEYHLRAECPSINDPDPEFFCADGIEKIKE